MPVNIEKNTVSDLGVEVPTYEEFEALKRQVDALERMLLPPNASINTQPICICNPSSSFMVNCPAHGVVRHDF